MLFLASILAFVSISLSTAAVLKTCQCGQTSLQTRIVGGKNADIGRHPWQVTLQRKMEDRGHHFCGGTIINSEWILTAAHCTQNLYLDKVKVGVGAHNKSQPTAWHTIAEVVNHPKYDHANWDLG